MKECRRFYIIIAFFVMSLSGCGASSHQTHTDNVVPTYQGMTVTRITQTHNRKNANEANGDENSEEHDPHEDSQDEITTSINDIVDINVEIDDEIKYYVQPNETFIIQVHLSNPNQYEIQSFTLNGKKYANYMFKDGSTMELLLLETTAPSTSGYIEYTIDAIKYIDGTEIKDADMSSGGKTIKAGVSYLNGPSATISSYEVGTTYLQMEIEIVDEENLIGNNDLAIYLTDNSDQIDFKKLHVGNNAIMFDGLVMSKSYQYGVVAIFDLVDGRDTHAEWLLTNTFNTLGAFKIINVNPTKTSIAFDIERTGQVGNIDSVSLYDSKTKTLIKKGEASIRSFNELLSGHEYDLYVDFNYQSNGELLEDWVGEKNIKTINKVAPIVSVGSLSSNKTRIDYNISFEDIDNLLTITNVELIKNGVVIKNNGTLLSGSFDNLLSNNDYQIKVTYSYDLNDGMGEIIDYETKAIKTDAKIAPTIIILDEVITDTSISASLELKDIDSVGFVDSVELFKNSSLIVTSATKDISFENLDYYTDYQIKVTYSYDLNDGLGIQTETIIRDYKTSPHLEFNSCKIANTSAVSEGDTIYMQVSLVNPSNALPSSVIINGYEYNCANATTYSKIFVEIINNGQFEGGETILIIERVDVTLDGKTYHIIPTNNNSDNVFVNGALEIVGLYASNVDGEKKTAPFFYSGETPYLGIELNNKTGYSLDSILLNSSLECSEMIKIDNNHWITKADFISNGSYTSLKLTSIHYHNETIDKTTASSQNIILYKVSNSVPVEITAKDQLKSMSGGFKCYSLQNDIDLNGEEWKGYSFKGVLLGNGYSIKNMSYVGTHYDSNLNLGLFSSVCGLIDEVAIEDATMIVNIKSSDGSTEYDIKAGFLSGESNYSCFLNCIINGASVINLTGNVSRSYSSLGGIVGTLSNTTIIGCTNNGSVSGRIHVGGLAGDCSYIKIIDSQTNGSVYGEESSGGFIGRGNGFTIDDSVNNGSVSGKSSIGGFIGECGGNNPFITNCTNNGSVFADSSVGGFVGWNHFEVNFRNCVNNGSISGLSSFDAFIGTGFHDSVVVENCVNNGEVIRRPR